MMGVGGDRWERKGERVSRIEQGRMRGNLKEDWREQWVSE